MEIPLYIGAKVGQKKADTPNLVRVMDFRGTYKGGGGPDKTILLSAAFHNRNRVDVLVTYLRDPKDREFQISERAAQLQIPFVEVKDRCLLDIICLRELNRLIREKGLDLVHAHDEKTLLYGFLLKLLNPRLKIVCTCHLLLDYVRDDFPSAASYLNFLLRKKVTSFLTKRFAKPIMAVSLATKNQLLSEGMRDDDVIVLYNGIDVDSWQRRNGKGALRREMRLSQDDLLVGTVARIDYQKDFKTFFTVVRAVKARIPQARFVIVGDGKNDELSQTKQLAVEMGLDQDVHFTGHRNDLLDMYSSFDLFLMTSLMEGLPNTVLEAMSMGIPVVSTRVAGVPELVVDGKTGYLCPVGDADFIAAKVIELLANPGARERFARNGRERVVESFSFKQRVLKLEDLYEDYARQKENHGS
jgi:L-malate glycosyltransferase